MNFIFCSVLFIFINTTRTNVRGQNIFYKQSARDVYMWMNIDIYVQSVLVSLGDKQEGQHSSIPVLEARSRTPYS